MCGSVGTGTFCISIGAARYNVVVVSKPSVAALCALHKLCVVTLMVWSMRSTSLAIKHQPRPGRTFIQMLSW